MKLETQELMMRIETPRHATTLRAAAMFALAALVMSGAALAVEVWTPDTGEVDLEELPRDSVEARFRHAAALITAGQAVSAAAQLEELLKQQPDAQWAERARFLIGVAHFADKKYDTAFAEWEDFHNRYPKSALARPAFEFQLQAALMRIREDMDGGQALFDRLIAKAPDKDFAVRCQKEKADAILAAGEFFRARDEYLALVDFFPDSPWVPYAWFKIAECDLRLAEWIRRGTEYLESSKKGFEDFLTTFPDHNLAAQAQDKLKEVRARQVAGYRRVAEYYMGPGMHPTAALPYLAAIRETLPDSDDARWADEKAAEIRKNEQVPLKGETIGTPLPGVAPAPQDVQPPAEVEQKQ